MGVIHRYSAAPSDEAAATVIEGGPGRRRGTRADAFLPFLTDLAALARHATDNGLRLYCWVCV